VTGAATAPRNGSFPARNCRMPASRPLRHALAGTSAPGTSRSKNPRSEPVHQKHQKSPAPLDAPLLTLVICSGVPAVAAVTAAGLSWSAPAYRMSSAARVPSSPALPSTPGADGQRTAPGERADRAFRMTVVAAIVRIHDGHELCAGRGRHGAGGRFKCAGQAPKLVASSSIPPGPDCPSAARFGSVAASPPAGPAFSGRTT
jgi:hypothetical protein